MKEIQALSGATLFLPKVAIFPGAGYREMEIHGTEKQRIKCHELLLDKVRQLDCATVPPVQQSNPMIAQNVPWEHQLGHPQTPYIFPSQRIQDTPYFMMPQIPMQFQPTMGYDHLMVPHQYAPTQFQTYYQLPPDQQMVSIANKTSSHQQLGGEQTDLLIHHEEGTQYSSPGLS